MHNYHKIKTQDVPDHYGMKISFIDGKKKEVFAVGHTVMAGSGVLSVRTKEDKIHWFPTNNVLEIEYDLAFTKILEAKEARAAQEAREEAAD